MKLIVLYVAKKLGWM